MGSYTLTCSSKTGPQIKRTDDQDTIEFGDATAILRRNGSLLGEARELDIDDTGSVAVTVRYVYRDQAVQLQLIRQTMDQFQVQSVTINNIDMGADSAIVGRTLHACP